MLERILVAVDGSDVSLRALDMGVMLAEKVGAKLLITHVVPPVVISGMEGGNAIALTELDRMQHTFAERLLEKATQRAQRSGVPLEHHLLEGGGIADRFVRAADEWNADLILLGSHGRGAVSRVFLGSVAHRVLNLSKRPVLVTH